MITYEVCRQKAHIFMALNRMMCLEIYFNVNQIHLTDVTCISNKHCDNLKIWFFIEITRENV